MSRPSALYCKSAAHTNSLCSPKDLSAAVDVYSDWVDACDAVAKAHGEGEGGVGTASSRPIAPLGARAADNEDDNIDDLIDDGDDDGAGGYGGEGVVADDDEY